MAGRPRLYASGAERMRAYRCREAQSKVTMDRNTLVQLEAHLERLLQAVWLAQARGDALAKSLLTVTRTDMLADLASFFETGALRHRDADA